jgi:hypothetical protein
MQSKYARISDSVRWFLAQNYPDHSKTRGETRQYHNNPHCWKFDWVTSIDIGPKGDTCSGLMARCALGLVLQRDSGSKVTRNSGNCWWAEWHRPTKTNRNLRRDSRAANFLRAWAAGGRRGADRAMPSLWRKPQERTQFHGSQNLIQSVFCGQSLPIDCRMLRCIVQ